MLASERFRQHKARNAGLAQLVERQFCKLDVAGSIPAAGTISQAPPVLLAGQSSPNTLPWRGGQDSSLSIDTERRHWVTGAGALAVSLGLNACGVADRAGSPEASRAPGRVVSLGPCLDAILVEVADRSQIAALSRYSRDPYGSSIAETAKALPFTSGTAEEIIALSPDLVLTGIGQTTTSALDRLSIRSEVFDVPETVAASLAQVRRIAALLYGLTHSASVPLEAVAASPPDLLLAGQPLPGAPSRAERMLQHPALAHLAGGMKRAVFPERLLFCGGPVLIQTAAALARARDAALSDPAR